jgi:hypothetical protein
MTQGSLVLNKLITALLRHTDLGHNFRPPRKADGGVVAVGVNENLTYLVEVARALGELGHVQPYTTGNGCFAECLKHLAKPQKHSAKALPSVALDKEDSTNSTSAKPSLPSTFSRALGKEVCRVPESTRQRKVVVTATR